MKYDVVVEMAGPALLPSGRITEPIWRLGAMPINGGPLVFALFLALVPATAFADAGITMLVIVWPLAALSIFPVVAVEAWIVRRELKVTWGFSLVQVTKANLLSMLIGIPLAWIVALIVEFLLTILAVEVFHVDKYPPSLLSRIGGVVLSAPWLGPFKHGAEWILPLATTVLLVPFFFASYWIEAWYVAKPLSPDDPSAGRRAVWKANVASYLMLAMGCLAWLAHGLATGRGPDIRWTAAFSVT